MKNKKLFNQIFMKLVATILLIITVSLIPIQSLAYGEFIKSLREKDSKEGPTEADPSTEGLWAYPFSQVFRVTAPFGYRAALVTEGGGIVPAGNHDAVDIGAPTGTPVLSPTDGVVVDAGFHTGGGFYVYVKRTDGFAYFMCHFMEQALVSRGDQIKLGQEIAYVGSTGEWTTGPHLHFAIEKDGVKVDPADYVDLNSPGISIGKRGSTNNLLIDHAEMIQDGDFFYKGIPQGHYYKSSFNLLSWIIDLIKQIADYLLGILTSGVKLGILGWGILAEVLLTDAFDSLVVKKSDTADYRKGNIGFYTDSKKTINVENIFFNRVEVLNVNLFESKNSIKERLIKYNPTGLENEEIGAEEIKAEDLEDGPLLIMRDFFAKAFLLMYAVGLILLFIGMLSNSLLAVMESVGSKKATYKQRAQDWLRAFVELFLIIFYMMAVLSINSWIIDAIGSLADKAAETLGGTYINTDMGRNYTIMETLRTRAYSFKFSVGLPATIMYLILMWYTIKYLLVYAKRFLVIFLLSLLGPLLLGYDLILKALKGKSNVRTDWIKEFTFNVVIQIIHAFTYLAFIPIIYSLASQSIVGFIIMFMLLKFMLDVDKLVRAIFNIRGAQRHSTLENVLEKSSVRDYAAGLAVGTFIGRGSITSRFGLNIPKAASKKVLQAGAFVGGGIARRGYNLIQSRREERLSDELRARRIRKKEEQKDEKVKEVLRFRGYTEDEIEDRFTEGSIMELTEEEKDYIRLQLSSATFKTNIIKRQYNKVKYSGRRLRRVFDDMGELDADGKRRIKSRKVFVDKNSGKIIVKGGVSDSFRKSVIKEFKMGDDDEGKEEYKKTIKDFKQAFSAGIKTFGGILFFPISFADDDVQTGLYSGLVNSFQFNSKTIGRPRGADRKTASYLQQRENLPPINRKIRRPVVQKFANRRFRDSSNQLRKELKKQDIDFQDLLE